MGLLDKVKGLGRMITGGGAEVALEVPDMTVGETAQVTVRAKIDDADLAINGVYILVHGCEEIRIEAETMRQRVSQAEAEMHPEATLDGEIFMEDTYSTRIEIAGEQELKADGEYEWTGEVSIPEDALPSYLGRRCSHVWRIQAGLDAFGNDPDSGWIEFTVK